MLEMCCYILMPGLNAVKTIFTQILFTRKVECWNGKSLYIFEPKMDGRSTRKTQRVADQAKPPFSHSLPERQKTGFCVNFFVRDVVLPIDA